MSEVLFLKYMECGGGEELGEPKTPECVKRDEQGGEIRYRDFQKGTIYWASQTGVCVWMEEKILQAWHDLEAKGHKLGFPMADWKEVRGKRLYRFQHGSIFYNPVLDLTKGYMGGRSLQDLMRGRSLFITGLIWSIGIVVIFLASLDNVDIVARVIVTLITLLLGPLTSHLFNLVLIQPINLDDY